MNRVTTLFIVAVVMFVFSAGCGMVNKSESIPPKHPEELESGVRPDCLECHEDVSTGALKPYETFRHTDLFVKQHRQYARQGQALCQACHQSSFCDECHARKTGLKPSVKKSDRPDRALPHRGDYIILHRLDGRVNPARCYKCHGKKNDALCASCHK